jgi:Uma2 family endonuclease
MSLPLLKKRPTTVAEYHRMARARVFGPDERVELLEGEIYQMPPIDPQHASKVKGLNYYFIRALGDAYVIGVQDPIQLDENSEPQPDISVLRWRADRYANAHPVPADVLLVVEVADSTVRSDRKHKIPLYARAGIPEAWLVNIPGRRVELHAEPVNGVYQIVRVFQRGETVQAYTLPQLSLAVDEILG